MAHRVEKSSLGARVSVVRSGLAVGPWLAAAGEATQGDAIPSAVIIAEPEYAPGRFVLVRAELSAPDRRFVWCGQSMGWLPLLTTSNALFHFFASEDEARKAADRFISLPVQE